MYGWIWRSLPGNVGAKVAESFALLIGALALLFFVVFPFIEPRLPWNESTVDAPSVGELQSPASSGFPQGSLIPQISPGSLPQGSVIPQGSLIPAG